MSETSEIIPAGEGNGHVLVALRGFDSMRAEVAQHVEAQRSLFIKITSHGLETGRLINEFAASNDLQAEVNALNKKHKDAGNGGRPVAYHCHVAKLLVQSGIGVSKEWLEKCARAHERAKALGFKVRDVNLLSVQQRETETVYKLPVPNGNATLHTQPAKVEDKFPKPIEELLPTPESVFPAPPNATPKPPKHFKDFVARFIGGMETIKTNAGEIGLRRKANQEGWADAVTAWWHELGVDVDITFKK